MLGRILSHCRIEEKLGEGGVGVVYRATDWPLVEQHCGYARAPAVVRDEMKFFNDDDSRWILGGTVEKLWPFRG